MVSKETKVKAAGAREGKYLTFQMAGEMYGIAILKVQEIIGMMPVTRVPRTPPSMRGVINLRGKVIPVVVAPEFAAVVRTDFLLGMGKMGPKETTETLALGGERNWRTC